MKDRTFLTWASALSLVLLMLCGPMLQAQESSPLQLTALDYYVRQADPNYRYSIVSVVEEADYTTYILEMTSQQWLTEEEVNLPLWEHIMTITAPTEVESDIGFLTISGGSKGNDIPETASASDIKRALESKTVVSTLFMVPNQPLVFKDKPENDLSEDGIIAYTWDKFLTTGDEKWPLRLPMTKSAVRAMDTVTSVMASEQAGAIEVDQFVVAGGSKRGWTTWTTAIVDNRVVAIMPIVIDLLNVEESFKHHFSVYGSYAPAVIDYVLSGNIDWIGTPEFASLMDLVEPYEYRARLELPKYLLNSTGDEFFLPDSWKFYWNDLVGEKHVRYVPNSNHGMGGTDVMDSVDSWYYSIVHNVSMPRYSWEVAEDGTITVLSLDEPEQVLLWQAHNPEARNFMQPVIGRAYTSTVLNEVELGVYKAKIDPPAEGFISYYIEMAYPSTTSAPLKFSSGVKVVPDTTDYEWEIVPASERRQ